jgi:hypothetical protein
MTVYNNSDSDFIALDDDKYIATWNMCDYPHFVRVFRKTAGEDRVFEESLFIPIWMEFVKDFEAKNPHNIVQDIAQEYVAGRRIDAPKQIIEDLLAVMRKHQEERDAD